MNNKLVWVVAVVVILVLGIGGGVTAALVAGSGDDEPGSTQSGSSAPRDREPASSTAPSGTVPAGLEEFYGQQLDWQPGCHGDTECATLTVPVDYGDPGGETVDLQLERLPAADQGAKVGSLVVNPGGPGAPGTVMAEDADAFFRSQLLERVDLVAFDPRGTGDSDPVDCLSDDDLDAYIAQDPTPDDAAEGDEAATMQEDFFAGCKTESDGLVGHVSTVEAARDMDVLRGVLGEEQLDYLGFSYGTTLGGVYAQLFPANVGRFVLDGATDPTLGLEANLLSQAAGFQTALDAYVDDCVESGDCPLGDSREEGLATIDQLFADIEADPLPTSFDRDLEIGNAFYGVAAPLYNQGNWQYLTQAFQQALRGQGDALLGLSDSYASRDTFNGGYTDNILEAIGAINCLDDPAALGPDEIPATYPKFEKASPTFGRAFAWMQMGCRGIEFTAAEPSPTIRAEGAAPIVVVGTTRDPATPYQEAVALADQLDSGVLLSRDGDGHTAYNSGNDCIDEAIEGYLLDGTVPADKTEC